MKDIQSQFDHRHINIQKVGVKNISYPITVLDKAKKLQRTVATVNMYVNLPHRFKGTHMSRFIEILNRFHGEIDIRSFHLILEEMKVKLEAEAAHIEIEFSYFLEKGRQQKTAVVGLGEYTCKMHGSFGDEYDLALEVKVPISPPLPGQSNGGLPRSLGHWGVAKVAIRFRHFIWIEDLIQMIEETIGRSRWGISSSCAGEASELLQEVVGGEENEILTAATSVEAAPEDSLTAAASLHPLFSMSVENITKALGHTLSDHPDISWFSVTVENLADGYSVFSSLECPSRAS